MDAREMNGLCVVCGKRLSVQIHTGGSYSGGHFFGKMTLSVGKKKQEEKVEYWECNACYSKA